MKALIYHGPREMSWSDWPEPQPGSGDVMVRVRAVGICGSDLHGYTGESGRRTPPMVMGHEATGEVIVVGPETPEDWIGRRVAIQPVLFCGTCDECRGGNVQRCRGRRFVGGNVSGAMAERVVVPARNLHRLSDTVSFQHGTLAEPLAVALHATGRAGDLRGRSVFIAGCGPIGLLTLVAARQAGARLVVATDVVATRRAMAVTLGATALDPAAEDWKPALGRVLGEGEVDVAFDAVGIPATFDQALGAVRPGGLVVAVGGWRTVPVELSRIVTREIHVVGTFNYTPAEFAEALRWIEEKRIDPARFITRVRPLAEGAGVFGELSRSRSEAGKVVLISEEVS